MVGFGLLLFILAIVGLIFLDDYDKAACVGVCIVFLFLVVISTIGLNVAQATHRNNIIANNECKVLYQKKVDELLPKITSELGKYPGYEKGMMVEVYKGKQTLITIPPELKANETIKQVAKEIKSAYDAIYDCDFKSINDRNALRINRQAGVWLTIYISN